MKFTQCITAIVLSAVAVPALGQHADALLAVDPGGKVVTGQYDFDTSSVININTRVYEAEFTGPFSNIWTTDEPGFNAISNTAPGLPAGYTTLPGSAAVSFDAKAFAIGASTSNLWHWDGAGGVNFAPVTNPTVLEVSKFPTVSFSSILDGSSSDVAGFTIETTGADGSLHKHIDFSVSNTDASAPDTGFYLWSLTFEADGLLQSDPVYFVHGLGIENEVAHEAAVDFVETVLVPEPAGTVLLSVLGGCALLRRTKLR